MLGQFAIGTAISLLNIGNHAFWTIVLDRAVQRYWGGQLHQHFTRDRFLVMMSVGAVLLLAHFIEVLVWALFYELASFIHQAVQCGWVSGDEAVELA